ncbi:LysM peptidoglycan-binding domain-containing protein [Xylanibacillus composti]|uniref:LysM domain-containing protein n=1 Tax=Xylanibacillus composti TaxID=1572762 RepID=A0A8J4H803_9BACL|nr:cell wall hydrolase [Xylanibacillus composti]MDT9724577.1 LysM peptidoglycan-binding domain-containing protein [Xylanibacillus composti]GIQ70263.1 hypothetical protein XYCOK13_30870 [Xylanibacillus composti]
MLRGVTGLGAAIIVAAATFSGSAYAAETPANTEEPTNVHMQESLHEEGAPTERDASSTQPDQVAEDTAETTPDPITMTIQVGKDASREDAVFIENDRVYVSLRSLADEFESEMVWDSPKISLHTAIGDKIVFTVDDPTMQVNGKTYTMDVTPIIKEDRIYLPLRHAAELMHASMDWDAAAKTAVITQVPLYTIQQGDTLRVIAEKHGVKAGLLKERNGLASNALIAGNTLKTVIPQAIAEKLPSPDVVLLAKIIEVEAGHESYEGQVAIGNVIMNRVESSLFPNTIEAVIYQPGQFPPAAKGMLENLEPDAEALKAAEAALDGEMVVPGALYFFNPNVSRGGYFDSLETVKDIGNHRFAK